MTGHSKLLRRRICKILWVVAALCGIGLPGCTTIALQNYTVKQAMTVSDLRYQQVVDNLAILADNPGNLVSFSIIDSGTATVQDTFSGDVATVWDHAIHGFSKETLTLGAKRSPDLQWTLSPVASEPQLAGERYACLWQLYGPPAPDTEAMSLLRAPMFGEFSGYHLAVADQLSRIHPGWFQVGPKKDIPRNARYMGGCGEKCVWVCPDGMAGLSEFTLVLLDIATLDPMSLALKQPYLSVESKVSGTAGKKLQITSSTVSVPATQSYGFVNGAAVPGPITAQLPDWSSDSPAFYWGDVGAQTKQSGGATPQFQAQLFFK